MTKEQIVDLCCDFVGITADRKKQFHPKAVELWIQGALNQVLYNVCLIGMKHQDFAQLDPFIKPYKNVAVVCETDRDEYYSVLPVGVVALPENRGIFRISPMKDQKHSFIFRENGTSEIYDELEYSLIREIPTFYQEMNNVFYDSRMNSEMAANGVLMKLIPQFAEYEDTDIIPLAGGKDNPILSSVLELLVGTKPKEDVKQNAEPTNIE